MPWAEVDAFGLFILIYVLLRYLENLCIANEPMVLDILYDVFPVIVTPR